ncbi:MAG: RNA-binding S4 domain-containing protein [Johnsonella sp.]|nr:RNA-binding S4 domain-containing protein [Johnsonella sp.]
MIKVEIKDEYIKLEQAMKLSGASSTGAEAKYAIKEGRVKVNDQVELQRGKKLRNGDIFTFNHHDYKIIGIEKL